jgi:hypothetical protein
MVTLACHSFRGVLQPFANSYREAKRERWQAVAFLAKDELDLIVPQRFYTFHQSKVGDQHVYACRSRFIPDVILDSFDAYSWHERVQRANRPAKKTGAATDVAAGLMRMWR